MIDNWLRNIKDIYFTHQQEVDAISDSCARADHMCELNIGQQVSNVCYTIIVQNAWRKTASRSPYTAGCTASKTACSTTSTLARPSTDWNNCPTCFR